MDFISYTFIRIAHMRLRKPKGDFGASVSLDNIESTLNDITFHSFFDFRSNHPHYTTTLCVAESLIE